MLFVNKITRKWVRLTFVFFICAYSFSVSAQLSSENNFYSNIASCDSTIDFKYAKVDSAVNEVYETWNWRITRKTKETASVLIEYKNEFFLFGLHNLKSKLNKEDLKLISKNGFYCINRKAVLPYLYINSNQSMKEYKGNSFYAFVFPNSKDLYQELNPITKYFNAVLYTNFEHLTQKSLVMLQEKIAHEGVHLFEQAELLNFSPEFIPSKFLQNNNVSEDNSNSKIIIDESCHFLNVPIEEFQSREYLKYKEKCISKFQEMVISEICLDYKLMQIIIENKQPTKETRINVHAILIEIKEILKNRSALFDDQDFIIELYWYLAEGVPQYTEQKISIIKDVNRVLDHYSTYCNSGYKPVDTFYPLFTGAAIWHGLEYLHEKSNDWDHLAFQSAYNVESTKHAEVWLDEFQSILDKAKLANK